jgi:hypothetical protein
MIFIFKLYASGTMFLSGLATKNSTFEKAKPTATKKTGTNISKNKALGFLL